MVAKVLMVTVASAAVAAATYFALNAKYPQHQAESASADSGDVQAVFAGTLDPNATADSDTATVAVAAEPVTAETVEVAAADGDTTEAAPAEDVAAPATEPSPEASIAPTAEPTAEPTPEPTVEPTPAPTVAPTPAPTAAPTKAPAATPKPAAPAASAAKPASKPAAPKAAITQWWGTPSDQRLSLTYAGSAAYTRAIVLMFNGDFDDAGKAASSLSVVDANGKPVAGTWQLGSANKRMLLFPVSQNGVYKVSVGAALADRTGRSLGTPLQGPVQVQ